jgi:hypothetical protein
MDHGCPISINSDVKVIKTFIYVCTVIAFLELYINKCLLTTFGLLEHTTAHFLYIVMND